MEQKTSRLTRSPATSPSFYGSNTCWGTLVLVIAILCIAPQYMQAQCPGSQMVVTMTIAQVHELLPAPGPLYAFIGGGCTTTAVFGPNPPTQCPTFTGMGAFYTARLRAVWANSVDNSTANGCTFICPGGTCRVRGGDALPVELMDFTIGESDDSEPAEDSETEDDSET